MPSPFRSVLGDSFVVGSVVVFSIVSVVVFTYPTKGDLPTCLKFCEIRFNFNDEHMRIGVSGRPWVSLSGASLAGSAPQSPQSPQTSSNLLTQESGVGECPARKSLLNKHFPPTLATAPQRSERTRGREFKSPRPDLAARNLAISRRVAYALSRLVARVERRIRSSAADNSSSSRIGLSTSES